MKIASATTSQISRDPSPLSGEKPKTFSIKSMGVPLRSLTEYKTAPQRNDDRNQTNHHATHDVTRSGHPRQKLYLFDLALNWTKVQWCAALVRNCAPLFLVHPAK